VQYLRIYAGPDGESHLEDVSIESAPGINTPYDHAPNFPRLQMSPSMPAKGVTFIQVPAEREFIDWHPAPRRQIVVYLDGGGEITTSDGQSRRFGPGTVLLAEDTWGKGHTTRYIGGAQHCLFIPLAD
jgi:hypothetical protein